MQNRHRVATSLLLTLALGACGGRESGSQPAIAPPSDPAVTVVGEAISSTVAPGAAAASAAQPSATGRTDDLEAELKVVDQELGGTQQSVNQANDTSPDRADD